MLLAVRAVLYHLSPGPPYLYKTETWDIWPSPPHFYFPQAFGNFYATLHFCDFCFTFTCK